VTKRKVKRKDWITVETFALIDKKRECRRDSKEHKTLQREVRPPE